jgi:glycosyltransferase involved in cell wall biosynthesis
LGGYHAPPSRPNKKMGSNSKTISIIIPNYNKGFILEITLQNIFSSPLWIEKVEVIVVDDGSTDDSIKRIKKYPCKLICLESNFGASKARNIGAKNSIGKFLFFVDADCIIEEETLRIVEETTKKYTWNKLIVGGTYKPEPYDKSFFSTFQAIFVNHFELKNPQPDYIPTHAMIIPRCDFENSGGFREKFLPILEDVEFSHRMKRKGYTLVMDPKLQVMHYFGFNFIRSIKNAFRKSLYWSIYSLSNKDLFSDSGTAAIEFKLTGLILILIYFILLIFVFVKKGFLLILLVLLLSIILLINKELIKKFCKKGLIFTFKAVSYYIFIYTLVALIGGISGLLLFLVNKEIKETMRDIQNV